MNECECCAHGQAIRPRTVVWAGQRWRALICDGCAEGGHARQACVLCGEGVWHCARVLHAAETHPDWLTQMQNDPDPRGLAAATRVTPRHIGRLPLRMGDE